MCSSTTMHQNAESEFPELKLFGDSAEISAAISKHPSMFDEIDTQLQERLQNQTKALCQGLGAVHRLHKCAPELRRFLYLGIARYLSQFTTDCDWVSGAKWLLTHPIARYLGNPEPSRPGKPLLFKKRYYRWLSLRYEVFSEKNTFFFTSWLQAKRNCDPLGPPALIQAFRKHREGMQNDDCITDDLLDEIFQKGSNFTKLLSLVRKSLHRKLRDRAAKPSHHASYLSSRTKGGQRFDLILRTIRGYQKVIGKDGKPSRGLSLCPKNLLYDAVMESVNCDILVDMTWFPIARVGDRIVVNKSFEKRSPRIFDDVVESLKDFDSPDDFTTVHDSSYPNALVAPVMEPLKVRLVSAGPSRLYYSLKSFQLDLHSSIRTVPLFRLVGRPQSPVDLSDIIPRDLSDYARPRWLSADYASATDALSTSLGREILQRLSNGDPVFFRAAKALCSHFVEYPVIKEERISRYPDVENGPGYWKFQTNDVKHELPSVLQTNGQLMGSIVSFPVLCLANAAALDIYQRHNGRPPLSFEAYLRSALINGDDLVSVVDSDKELFRFKELSASLGLDLTVGKSYIHPTYANINSSAYHYNLEALWKRKVINEDSSHLFNDGSVPVYRHLPVPRDIGYFNTGLYGGKHKVQERVGGESLNLDVIDLDEDFSTEIHDPFVYDLTRDLPRGAMKLRDRLQRRGIQFPKEGDRPLWAIANRVYNGTPEGFRHEVQVELSKRVSACGEDIFFYRFPTRGHSGKWRWARRNHRLPISAGGLGLFPSSPDRFRLTRVQRMVASYLRDLTASCGACWDTQKPLRQPDQLSRTITRHPFSMKSDEVVTTPTYEWEKPPSTFWKASGAMGIIPSGGPCCVV